MTSLKFGSNFFSSLHIKPFLTNSINPPSINPPPLFELLLRIHLYEIVLLYEIVHLYEIVLLRRRYDVPIRRRRDVPLRCLGDVPSRRRWVFHLGLINAGWGSFLVFSSAEMQRRLIQIKVY